MSLSLQSQRRVAAKLALPAACLLAIVASAPPAAAQSQAGNQTDPRIVTIDHPGDARPAVQVALPAGMFADLRGLVDAALAGAGEALQADGGENQEATRLAAEHIAAIREVTQMLEGAIEEVRVQLYDGRNGESLPISVESVADHYAKKLTAAGWDQVVRASEGDGSANVFLLRDAGALRGVFVVAGEHGQMALVNAACDISPQRLKELTHRLTSLWLEVGGREQLQHAAERLQRMHEH